MCSNSLNLNDPFSITGLRVIEKPSSGALAGFLSDWR